MSAYVHVNRVEMNRSVVFSDVFSIMFHEFISAERRLVDLRAGMQKESAIHRRLCLIFCLQATCHHSVLSSALASKAVAALIHVTSPWKCFEWHPNFRISIIYVFSQYLLSESALFSLMFTDRDKFIFRRRMP